MLFVCVCVCPGCVFYVAIMRFMGDSPLRGLTEQEVVSTFLKVNIQIIFRLVYSAVFSLAAG